MPSTQNMQVCCCHDTIAHLPLVMKHNMWYCFDAFRYASQPGNVMICWQLSTAIDCRRQLLNDAGKLIEEMQSGAEPDTDPRSLTSKQILMLHQLLHVAKFSDPSGSHLSPAGGYLFHNLSI